MAIAENPPIEVSLAAVEGPKREQNRKVLQPILVDLIATSLNIKQLHWNIVGPHFRPIHLHLDEIHDELEEAVDLVAERLSATGHSPSGRAKDVVDTSEIEDVPEGFIRDDEVLLLASYRLRNLIGLIRSRTETIETLDTVTADLLHGIARDLEKQHWMVQAQRV